MAALITCPKCRGVGRPRFAADGVRCDLCQGTGHLSDDFAARTAAPRREGTHAECDFCFRVGYCLPVEVDEMTWYACGKCWTKHVHPDLLVCTDRLPA